jgi:cytochrome c oxidase accessory protein FixG
MSAELGSSERVLAKEGGRDARPTSTSVLSTLNADGSRRWLKPKPSFGRFWHRRRIVAYGLIAIFTLLPWVKINGHPAVQLDLATRHFYIFGATFLPTDTLLLALLLVGVFIGIFLFTAVFGRVWCGWACPQTVYMEYVFRPIERLLEGTPGRARKGFIQTSGVGTALKYAVFLVVAAHLANTFLAYFVGVDALMVWTLRSPLEHPTPFLVFAAVTGLMMFDFAFFREQTCLVACPYGRFQSVLLDRQSVIVSYDKRRGEPRGKGKKGAGDISLAILAPEMPTLERTGDCVDCGLCVTTCPTGIDIRNGLQMECVHCTQCIDACDAVMVKLNRPRGLIRYASQATLAGETKKGLRPRLVAYPLILLVVIGAFVTTLVMRAPVEVKVMRARGVPYYVMEDGRVGNSVQVVLINRLSEKAEYRLSVAKPAGLVVEMSETPVELQPGQNRTVSATIVGDAGVYAGTGRVDAVVKVEGGPRFAKEISYRVFGPMQAEKKEAGDGK